MVMIELEKLINTVNALRENTKDYDCSIRKLLNISPDASDPRRSCFVLVYNSLILTLELLMHYRDRWSNPLAKLLAKLLAKFTDNEKMDRYMTISRWLFIASMSAIEYSAKASIRHYREPSTAREDLLKPEGEGYTYLGDIMKNSKKKWISLISNDEYADWKNLIFLRNCIVHNNGYSDEDRNFIIGEAKVTAKPGNIIEGSLDCFVIFTRVALERYFSWVKALVEKYGV